MLLFNLIIVILCAMAIPLNFAVAFVILKERIANKRKDNYFRSSFFDLVLFQLFLDPPALIFFFTFYVLKAEPPINDWIFDSTWSQMAAWSYYCLYLVLYCKMVGIILITAQRLCAVCFQTAHITTLFDHHPIKITCVCMLASPLLTAILWGTSDEVTYSDRVGMALLLNKHHVTRNVSLAACLILFIIVASTIAYCRIYVVMRRMMHGSGMNDATAMKAQLRMTMQGFGQVIALCFIDAYFFIVWFGTFPSSEDVEVMRRFYHAFYFFLSALNPISLIILSDKTRDSLFCRERFRKGRVKALDTVTLY